MFDNTLSRRFWDNGQTKKSKDYNAQYLKFQNLKVYAKNLKLNVFIKFWVSHHKRYLKQNQHCLVERLRRTLYAWHQEY